MIEVGDIVEFQSLINAVLYDSLPTLGIVTARRTQNIVYVECLEEDIKYVRDDNECRLVLKRYHLLMGDP